jgi:flagellar biosynthesis chaperone FliJ
MPPPANIVAVEVLSQIGGATGSQQPVQFVQAAAASQVNVERLADLLSQCLIPRQVQVDKHEQLIDEQADIIAQQASKLSDLEQRLMNLEQRVNTFDVFSDPPAHQTAIQP